MRIRHDIFLAGPLANPVAPTLKTLNQATEVLGPGRNHGTREHMWDIVWPPDSTAGEVTIEVSHDGTFTGTWAPLVVIAWSAANKVDHYNYTGSIANSRVRMSVAVLPVGLGVGVRYQANA